MTVIRARKSITDADIPTAIARDTETEAAINAHVTALHPFPVFGFGQNVSTENVFDFGSGFLDCRQGGGIFPSNMGHIQGFQSRHNNSAGAWGMQLVTQNNIDNECYFRTVDWGTWKPWRRIWNDGNFNPTNYLQISASDARYRQSAVALTDADIPVSIARDAETASAINAHLTATDPHPVYLTQPEGDARYGGVLTTVISNSTCITPATQGNAMTISHGLIASKIVGIQLMIEYAANSFVGENNGASGFEINILVLPSTINISAQPNNSQHVLTKPFKVLIRHLP